MPVSTQTSPGQLDIDESTRTLRFVRDLDAAPQAVFDAWTKPTQLAAWWDPDGERLSTCEIDLRVGGHFTFIAPSHADRPFTGTYVTIDPPHLLAFDAVGATGHVRITPLGTGSRLTVEIASPNAAHFEQMVAVGAHRGTAQTLDNLVAYLDR